MPVPRIRSILAATDFSEDARHAAGRAAMLASGLGAGLSLLHVISAPMLGSLRSLFASADADAAETRVRAQAQQSLDTLAVQLEGHVGEVAREAGREVRVGRVLDEILSAADEHDLLVVGPRGSSPLRDLILGTTVERLLSKSLRPVLVARKPAHASYQRVVVAMDFSPDSVAALRIARQVAPQAELTAVHAYDLPFAGKLWAAGVQEDEIERYRANARQSAMRALERIAADAGLGPMQLATIVQQGHAGRLVLEHAAQLDADLIIVGKHGLSKLEELMLGSVTRHVLADAPCDVLVARRRPDDPQD